MLPKGERGLGELILPVVTAVSPSVISMEPVLSSQIE